MSTSQTTTDPAISSVKSEDNPDPTQTSAAKVKDGVKTIGETVKSKARETKDALVSSSSQIAQGSRDLANEKLEHARERFNHHAEHFNSRARASMDSTRERIREQPLKSLAIAAGVGWFLGRFILNGR